METRDIYKEKYQAQIHEWTAQLDVLKARAEKMSAQAKLDAKPSIDTVHTSLEGAKAKLRDIASATDDKWDDVKAGIDRAWTETKAKIEGAYDAVMAMEPAAPKAATRLATPNAGAAKQAPAPRR